MPNLAELNLAATLPALSVAVWACVLLLADLFVPKDRKQVTAWLAAGGLGFAFVANLLMFNSNETAFMGMYQADQFTAFMNVIILVAAFISVLFTGSLLTEVIFSLDGLGLLGFEAAISRDYPVMFGTLYFFGLVGLVMGIVGDLIYTVVDPRIDFEARRA